MTTVVVYSWARDASSAIVRSDGAVDWRSTRMSAGEDDHAAVTAARSIAEAGSGALVGVTIGSSDPSWALARGVPEAISVTDAPALDDEAATAAVLAGAVRTVLDADVVVIGDAEEHPLVAPALAAALGWPAVLGVTEISSEEDGVRAVRRTGAVEEVVTVTPPVLLGVRAQSTEPQAPGMKELLAARKRPVERRTLADLGLDLPAPMTELGTRRPAFTGAVMLEGSPAEAARALVAALRAEGVA